MVSTMRMWGIEDITSRLGSSKMIAKPILGRLSSLMVISGRTNEILCHTMIVFIATYTVVCIIIAFLQCRPIRAHWNPQTGLECMNMRATLAAITVLNIFSDMMVYL